MTDSDAAIRTGADRRPQASGVCWNPWTADVFARARDSRTPVLLSLTARWCHGCAVMDRLCYADAGIAATVNRRFVPIRVDVDRRPDIYDRYNLEGLPTTAFLTPSGEILTGSTYLPPEQLASLLVEVADAYAARGGELEERAAAQAAARRARDTTGAPASAPDLSAPDWLTRQLVTESDPLHGGFGQGGKFAEAAALAAGLAMVARARDAELAGMLTTTLRAMADGGLRDRVEGGFFRYASGRDWSRPHTEKRLEDQAAIIRLYLEAGRVFDQPAWFEVARDTLEFIRRVFLDGDRPGFGSSQCGDEVYYQAPTVDARRRHRAPSIDWTRFTDVNAQTAVACLEAVGPLEDPSWGQIGTAALDQVVSASFRPGEGVAHWDDGAAAGALLTDQVHAAAALLTLFDATDNETCADLAEELMRAAHAHFWDDAGGGFFDRRPTAGADVGLLADPLKPLAANCQAARVLARLAGHTGNADLQRLALETLGSQATTYRRHGLAGAIYAHTVLDLLG
jgi:uncharacterized protein